MDGAKIGFARITTWTRVSALSFVLLLACGGDAEQGAWSASMAGGVSESGASTESSDSDSSTDSGTVKLDAAAGTSSTTSGGDDCDVDRRSPNSP